MNEHLSFDEIIQAVNKNPESLAGKSYSHLWECAECQKIYHGQLNTDRVLKDIMPRKAPLSLSRKVIDSISRISPVKIRQKTDWIFMFSMILLFSVVSWYLFSGRAGSLIQQYVPGIITEKQQNNEPGILDTIKDSVSAFEFRFTLPDFNFGNIYLAIGILVIIFYMLIDRKIHRNFKVHKT